MTRIDTVVASKHWTKDGASEIDFLKAIQFVALTDDGENISLPTDEEGNSEIILTPKSAKWVAERLIDAVKQIEGGLKRRDI